MLSEKDKLPYINIVDYDNAKGYIYPIEILNVECNKTLRRIDLMQREDVITLRNWFGDQLLHTDYIKDHKAIDFDIILCILLSDGFIKDIEQAGGWYVITAKGKAFVNTDSYSKRFERCEINRLTKERQLELNKLELRIKPYTFWIAVASIIIAVISLYVSIKKQ